MGLLSRMSRAATALTKYYIPYTWRNKPSIVSPVNEVNLNHIEDGINELDNRILILAQDKADAADVANVIIDFTMDDTTGVMTFTRFDGSTFTHDTAVEKIALNCYLEGVSASKIVLFPASFSPTKMFTCSLNTTSREVNFLNPSICKVLI